MTEAEICGSFRRAENKKNQIQIISELSLMSKEEVIEILLRNGYTIPDLKPGRNPKDCIKKPEATEGKGELPTAVKIALTTRIDFLEKKIAELKEELQELTEYMGC